MSIIQTLNPAGFPAPLAPYSSATRAGNAVHVSGMLPIAQDGSCHGVGDVRAQTRYVLELIRATLKEAGADLRDIAFNQIFLQNMADYAAMNEVYREFFPIAPPARYCIQAGLVKPEFLVEIACTAYVGTVA
jgi:aminoacrylate peracid reductase